MITTYLSFCFCFVTFRLVAAQYMPDTKASTIRELEHLYLDSAPGFISAVSPCSQYIDPTTGASSNSFGRQTAAEWIRLAFRRLPFLTYHIKAFNHLFPFALIFTPENGAMKSGLIQVAKITAYIVLDDFVTGNIYSQSGGLDASIGFETARTENVGPAFNDGLTFFSYFFNQKVTMSDLIALGTVMATASCGGPHVKLRAGRIDATAAGPSGVPEPETDLKTTLTTLGNAGFNTPDTIALTACGHTMGGVHQKDFPQVVTSDTTATLEGSDGRAAFDETPNSFDYSVAADYVASTGSQGGPLVTTSNTTVQSDLRLYTSDQNKTIDLMAQSNDYFLGQCSSLFQRMIETVPSAVRFISPAVDPTTTTNLKPYGIHLDIDWSGSMTLSGSFRYVQVAGANPPPTTLTITLISRVGKTTTTSTDAQQSGTDTGTGIWGPTRSYDFTLTFAAVDGISGVEANGVTFYFQDSMFVVPSLSPVSPNAPTFSTSPSMNTVATYSINTTVAYLSASPPTSLTATFAIPQPQTGTVSPAIGTSTTTLNLIGTANGFGFYSAVTSEDLSGKQAYGTSIDVATADGSAPGVVFYKPFA